MLNKDMQVFFEEEKRDKDAVKKAHSYMTETADRTLREGDYDELLKLLPYLEEGDGAVMLPYCNDVHELVSMLGIIKLEKKYASSQTSVFCAGCKNLKELQAKYHRTIFAIRRLIFMLSEESMEEAVGFLKGSEITELAFYMLAQNALGLSEEMAGCLMGVVYGEG